MISSLKSVVTLAAVAMGLCACEPRRADLGPRYEPVAKPTDPMYVLAVFPVHNPVRLAKACQPLIRHLNRCVPRACFGFEASPDFTAFDAKIRARGPHLLVANPLQAVRAIDSGYTVVAMLGAPEDFRGVLLTRSDAGIRSVADLKGKVVGFPSFAAPGATIMVRRELFSQGVDFRRDFESRYVGSLDSPMENLLVGRVHAAGTTLFSWKKFQASHPAEAATLSPLLVTPSLVNNAVLVRDDLPADCRAAILAALRRRIADADYDGPGDDLDMRRMRDASNADYEAVRAYVARFEAEFGKVVAP